MQKNLPKYAPDWIRTVADLGRAVETHGRRTRCATTGARCCGWPTSAPSSSTRRCFVSATRDRRPHLVLDIDPPEDADFRVVVRAAELVQHALADAGLDGAVKTSGAKGVHIFVPVTSATAEEAAAATRAIAARAERLDPELATTAFVRDERDGKVFLDSTRAGGATVAAAYSPRMRAGLPVSFPVSGTTSPTADPRRSRSAPCPTCSATTTRGRG